jgi:TP901 family phage tail tape measure protein
MADTITQKLGFDASSAINNLAKLKGSLDAGTAALREFKGAADAVGGGTAAAANLGTVSKKAEEAKKTTGDLTISWKTMVRVLQTQIVLRAINAFIETMREGVESARELGLAIAEIQTIGQDMNMGSGQITSEILALSDAIGKAPKDLAEGLYQTLSNQVVSASEAFEFNAQATRLATIAVSENADAIDALSSVINSYGLEASEAERISGTLFAAVDIGRFRLDEIANSLGKVLPLSAQLGVAWEDVAGSIALMTQKGVKADTALTQLRAIFQQLIRPGDPLKEQFSKWGVDNAEQAIRVFGGFPGLMRKISEETNDSSDEVGELFRRVRAIAGYFGIAAENGGQLAEAIEQIKEGGKNASDIFKEFTEADAFKLTQATQQWANIWTRLGTATLPLVNFLVGGMSNVVNNTAQNLQNISDSFDLSARLANTLKSEMGLAAANIEKLREESQKTDIAAIYKDAVTAANQYYVEANKQEYNLIQIRKNAIDVANAGLKALGESIIGVYEASIKDLKDKIKEATDAVKDAQKDIESINGEIASRQLNLKLKNAKTERAKLLAIDKEVAKSRADVANAFGRLDGSKEASERAQRASDSLIKLLDLASSTTKNTRLQNKYEKEAIGALRNKQSIAETTARISKNSIPALQDELKMREENAKKLKQLAKERYEQLIKLNEDSLTDQQRQGVIDAVAEIDKKVHEIFGKAELGDQFLRSLGLDLASPVVVSWLTSTLNQGTKDWEAEVARAQAAFDKSVINIKVAVQQVASTDTVAKSLGVEKRPGEKEGEFASRVTLAAEEQLKTSQAQRLKVAEKQATITALEKVAVEGLKGANQEISELQARILQQGRLRYIQTHENATETMALAAGEKRVNDFIAARPQLQNQVNVKKEIQGYIDTLQQGKTIEAENLRLLDSKIEKLANTKQINLEVAQAMDNILPILFRWNQQNEEIKKGMPNEELAGVAQAFLDQLQPMTAIANKAAEFKTNYDNVKISSDAAAKKTGEMATGASNTATSMGNAATNTNSVTTAAQIATGAINVAKGAATGLANELERAARAQAAAGSGASQYFGGPMKYFAQGGRGQDNIHTMLSKGETVVNSRNSRKFFSELNAMNQGSQPVYREQGGTVTNVGDINVTVQGGDSSQQTVREIGRQLRREVQRNNIKLR